MINYLNSKLALVILITSIPIITFGQKFETNIFLRTPQVVNFNFNQNQISYSSVISFGTGFSYKSKFLELATFINDEDIYGFYTFFGTALKSEQLGGNWSLNTNWFGEVTYIPKQSLSSDAFTYTTGLCFFLNYSFEWGSIGLPICIGTAYSQKTISLNTRTVLNISLNIN